MRALLVLAGLLATETALAETRWISDEVSVQIRSEPSSDSQPVGTRLTSGAELELVDTRDAFGFSRVRTRDGVEGWIATRYLTTAPTARLRLEAANERIAALEAELAARDDGDVAVEALNARLRTEIDALVAERDALAEGREQRGMWLGAGLLVAGLAIGALLKSRPRRSGWS
jgi:SH3 domain protein